MVACYTYHLTSYHLLAAQKQGQYKNAYLQKKVYIHFWKQAGDQKEKIGDNRTRQNNKGADRKMESNDSPDIPDRGEASEEPRIKSYDR